jgi:hypothetical protein
VVAAVSALDQRAAFMRACARLQLAMRVSGLTAHFDFNARQDVEVDVSFPPAAFRFGTDFCRDSIDPPHQETAQALASSLLRG